MFTQRFCWRLVARRAAPNHDRHECIDSAARRGGGDLGLQTNALLMHELPTALSSYSDRVVEQLLDWPAHSAKLEQRGRFRRYYRMPLSKFSVLAAALRAKEESFFAVGAQHSVSWATAPFSAELRLR